jgi:hypothetical protein
VSSLHPCVKKSWYHSKAFADKIAARRTEIEGHEVRSYQCADCWKWHLTKQPRELFDENNRRLDRKQVA